MGGIQMSLKRSLLIFILLILPLTGLMVNGVLYLSSSYQSCLSFSATEYSCGAGLVAKDLTLPATKVGGFLEAHI
jgi:hypothetical protein